MRKLVDYISKSATSALSLVLNRQDTGTLIVCYIIRSIQGEGHQNIECNSELIMTLLIALVRLE